MNNLWGMGTASIEQKTITSVFDWNAAFGLPGHSQTYCLDPGKGIVSRPGAGFSFD
ncbi:MAG: hypothetical protein RIG77_21245 [Cyclobacteriaceae bacterium]